LAGAHVRLEPVAERHVPALLDAAADAEVWRWLPWPQPRDEVGMRALLETVRAMAIPFAQVEVAKGRAVGMTCFLDVQPRNRTIEVGGTWLGRPWWRTAINTEAKLLMLGHAFDALGANRVALKTDARNTRSQEAITRLGAQREGVLRRHMVRPDGSLRDTVMFSVIREEWPAVRDRLRARLAAG
ncbi:MAG TPA: GNAT family protein, partial [Solirubrobacteraceae bacterium]|nr:GNAT family protein [Solirubrobacteraceae bacterium]